MLGGAYTLSRDAHVRADIFFRLMSPRKQAALEFVLYFLFFFPGILALIFAGWKYVSRSWRYLEVSTMSPANIPIYQFKTVIIVAGVLLFLQGIAQVMRCMICLRTGAWPPPPRDVEELEKLLVEEAHREALRHSGEAVDVVIPDGIDRELPDDQSGSRRPPARGSRLHDHAGLSGRLHADGARNRLRLLRLLRPRPFRPHADAARRRGSGLSRRHLGLFPRPSQQPHLRPLREPDLLGHGERYADGDPALPVHGLHRRAREHREPAVPVAADRLARRCRDRSPSRRS